METGILTNILTLGFLCENPAKALYYSGVAAPVA